jgi:serine/threonine-protein kinase
VKDASPPLEVTLLGRHHVIGVLGEDEIGTVHLARVEGPSGFQRWVALRTARKEFARDSAFKDRFYAAARAGAAITHANVAQTLEVGETDGVLWMATEYLHGEPLSDVLEQTRVEQMPLPWDIAARIASDVAFGVDALHDLRARGRARTGVVHGRFAPRHAVVTYDGMTKVVGVPIDASGVHALADDEATYAAPEVLDGGAPDSRSDIWSLGVVLWELVSGRRLFWAETRNQVRAKVEARQVRSLRKMSLGCPDRIDKIVMRALALDPTRRFVSARELAQSLQAALVTEALVVTDDDVGRTLLKLFTDR